MLSPSKAHTSSSNVIKPVNHRSPARATKPMPLPTRVEINNGERASEVKRSLKKVKPVKTEVEDDVHEGTESSFADIDEIESA